jgi:hypothetical protein
MEWLGVLLDGVALAQVEIVRVLEVVRTERVRLEVVQILVVVLQELRRKDRDRSYKPAA